MGGCHGVWPQGTARGVGGVAWTAPVSCSMKPWGVLPPPAVAMQHGAWRITSRCSPHRGHSLPHTMQQCTAPPVHSMPHPRAAPYTMQLQLVGVPCTMVVPHTTPHPADVCHPPCSATHCTLHAHPVLHPGPLSQPCSRSVLPTPWLFPVPRPVGVCHPTPAQPYAMLPHVWSSREVGWSGAGPREVAGGQREQGKTQSSSRGGWGEWVKT